MDGPCAGEGPERAELEGREDMAVDLRPGGGAREANTQGRPRASLTSGVWIMPCKCLLMCLRKE